MERRTFLVLMSLGGIASTSPLFLKTILAQTQEPKTSKSSQSKAEEFYIAPNGNDAWSGKQATPNAANTDGPFASIARSRDAIRQLKQRQGGKLKQPVTVFLRGGTYFLVEPLTFTPQDSGTAEAPITYTAYQNEKPVISGGRVIKNWQSETVDGKQLWVAEIPEVQQGKCFFRQLWVNGERRRRARYPKQGYLQVDQVPEVTPNTQWNEGQKSFKFRKGDLKAWKTVDSAEAIVMTLWTESHLPITSIDENQKIVNFGKQSVFKIVPGSLYYVEHALEILEEPGEWYLDKNTGKLYCIPMPDEKIQDVEVIAPILPGLVKLLGDQAAGQFIDYLSFKNLTFSHTDWYFNSQFLNNQPLLEVSGFVQAAYGVPGAIYGQGIRHCSWQNCQVANIGQYGIELFNGCSFNKITNCQLFDLGAGGIKISDGTHSTEVTNCSIYNGGRVFHGAIALLLIETYNNQLSKNQIYDFYYTAINLGWVWGYGASKSKNNIIEANNIHHIGKLSNGDGPILNELAGIYTLGQQPGTVIRSNVIHHIHGRGSGGVDGAASGIGFYLDEGTSYLAIENNLVYQTDIGFHLHYGLENIVRNNIFAFGKEFQISRIVQEPHLSFRFERNLVYWRDGKLLAGKWGDSNVAVDRNLYWHLDSSKIRFSEFSWEEWQARGMDKNSLIADPLFVAPDKGNFQLNSNSPAFQLGFQPIANLLDLDLIQES
jgi:parallel beta-helix repeat protein